MPLLNLLNFVFVNFLSFRAHHRLRYWSGLIGGLAYGTSTVLDARSLAQGILERLFQGSVLQEAVECIWKGICVL